MARTVADVIASARPTLNDADGVRYTDPELVGFVTDALYTIKNGRPDLFLGFFGTPLSSLSTTSDIPLDDQFFRPIVDYVIFRCETKDDEHVVAGRAELMAKLAIGFMS